MNQKRDKSWTIFLGFIFIIFSIASWDAFEILVGMFLSRFWKDTPANRLIVFLFFIVITLIIIIKNSELNLLADDPKHPTLWEKTKQVLVGFAVIILWIASWDAFEILVEYFLGKRDTPANRFKLYLLITLITLYVIVSTKELDLLVWN